MSATTSLLPVLASKAEIDNVIRKTEDKVVALTFGRTGDMACLQMDDVLSKASPQLRRMAVVYSVQVDSATEYVQYFDIRYIPSTVFFFNAQHVKVDYGTPDHTKFVGPVANKQDFIDLVEVIYRGAMRGKNIVDSPIDPRRIPKYDLLYNDV